MEARTEETGFWNDNLAGQRVMREINLRKSWVDDWRALRDEAADTEVLVQLGEEAGDESLGEEIESGLEALTTKVDALEFRMAPFEVADRTVRPKRNHQQAGIVFVWPNIPDSGLVRVVQFLQLPRFADHQADRFATGQAASGLTQHPLMLGVLGATADRRTACQARRSRPPQAAGSRGA